MTPTAPAAACDPQAVTNGCNILVADASGVSYAASVIQVHRHPVKGVLVSPSYMGFGPNPAPREPLPYSADGKPGTWRFA